MDGEQNGGKLYSVLPPSTGPPIESLKVKIKWNQKLVWKHPYNEAKSIFGGNSMNHGLKLIKPHIFKPS